MWLEVADLSLAQRAEPLKAQLNGQLLEVLVNQCTFPSDFDGDWDNVSTCGVDEDVLSELRGGGLLGAGGLSGHGSSSQATTSSSSGVGDVLSTCFHVLKSTYFVNLTSRLQPGFNSAAGAAASAAADFGAPGFNCGGGIGGIGGGSAVVATTATAATLTWQPAEAALFSMASVGKDAMRVVGQELLMVSRC